MRFSLLEGGVGSSKRSCMSYSAVRCVNLHVPLLHRLRLLSRGRFYRMRHMFEGLTRYHKVEQAIVFSLFATVPSAPDIITPVISVTYDHSGARVGYSRLSYRLVSLSFAGKKHLVPSRVFVWKPQRRSEDGTSGGCDRALCACLTK
jgi:hypothetical protein